jgi:hypothetical protein
MSDEDEVIRVEDWHGFVCDFAVDGKDACVESVGVCDAVVSLVRLGVLHLQG